jgi:cellulose synthase/poly-beta-1,6-N-acetylglucosamine synthase-like glycosyltransferase
MTQQPFISIIIPVLNAQKWISPCLEALLLQDYPKDKFEIIVLDNGSTDQTMEITKKYPVKLLIKTKCNISALRNWGAAQARGEIFAFIDGWVMVCPARGHYLGRKDLGHFDRYQERNNRAYGLGPQR